MSAPTPSMPSPPDASSADPAAGTSAPPPLDERLLRQSAAGPDPVARWMQRATFHSIKVQRGAATPAAIAAALDACLAPHTVTRCLLNAHAFEEQAQLPAYLAARRVEVLRWGAPDCFQAAYACELAITDCRCGLADSGGVVVWSDATFGRSSTLVIPIHIVLLPADRILPDLIDGLEFMRQQNPELLPSNIVIINGPSKTADIEMNLITGVHGPKHLYVVLLEEG